MSSAAFRATTHHVASSSNATITTYMPAKKWGTASRCLDDHLLFLKSHPILFGAYTGMGSEKIEHDLVETVMVAVNSVNDCPYCDGLHGSLARIAGVEDAPALRAGQASCALLKKPAVKFAVAFAQADGRGTSAQYQALVKAEGEGRAASIRALSLFLIWGSTVGNTVNGAKSKLLLGEAFTGLTLFELTFFAYYGPLFFAVPGRALLPGEGLGEFRQMFDQRRATCGRYTW